MKKLCQGHLMAHKHGLPAPVRKALQAKFAVMCIIIELRHFAEVFQRICLTVFREYEGLL
jgi:hypothetical protein